MAKAYKITIDINDQQAKRERARTTARTVDGTTVEEEKSVITGAKVLATFNYAKRYVRQYQSFETSMITTRTGQAKMQQKIEFAHSVANRAFDFGESVLAGLVLTGGNPLGAVVGAATNIAGMAVSYAQSAERLNTQRAIERVQIDLNSARISTSGERFSR